MFFNHRSYYYRDYPVPVPDYNTTLPTTSGSYRKSQAELPRTYSVSTASLYLLLMTPRRIICSDFLGGGGVIMLLNAVENFINPFRTYT